MVFLIIFNLFCLCANFFIMSNIGGWFFHAIHLESVLSFYREHLHPWVELIFIPFVGQAFKILGFPMMKRHSKEQIAKNPALKTRDMEEARKSCEQLLSQPFTLLNYLEGTRFTPEKHAQQQSPYQNLLKPKAGGLALALSILGNDIDALVDMTIVYPDGAPGYSEFWLGDVPRIAVNLRKLDIPAWVLAGNYEEDADFREQFQQWVDQLWAEKDQLIEQMKAKYSTSNLTE